MKKCAIVGVGGRHKMFREALVKEYAVNHQLVAICDSNPVSYTHLTLPTKA